MPADIFERSVLPLEHTMSTNGAKDTQAVWFVVTHFLPLAIFSQIQSVVGDAAKGYVNSVAAAGHGHVVVRRHSVDFGLAPHSCL